MITPVSSIIHRTVQQNEKLNILYFPYNGYFEWTLADVPHNFYVLPYESFEPLAENFTFPSNFKPIVTKKLPLDLNFDLVWCNEYLDQIEKALEIAHGMHVPLLHYEHRNAPSYVKIEDTDILNKQKMAHIRAAVSIDTVRQWNWLPSVPIIPYSIPQVENKTLEDKKPLVLICGNFDQSDYAFLHQVQQQSSIPVKIIGSNENISKPRTYQEQCKLFEEATIYIDLLSSDTTPLYLLLAMSYGCIPIVTNKDTAQKCNASMFFAQNPQEVISNIKTICGLPTTGHNSTIANLQSTIRENFPFDSSCGWNKLLNETSY